MGGCTVHQGYERGTGYTLSVSHPSRYPTWDEVTEARYRLIPDKIEMAMPLPPRAEYLNIHPYMFNLFEVELTYEERLDKRPQ